MFTVPIKGNRKLKKIVERINKDLEIQTLWKCANVTAIDRMGYSDHGPIHAKIVSNFALKILRLLMEAGIKPSVVEDYGMKNEDAEVVVVLASALHDVGMSVHRDYHNILSVPLAAPILDRILEGVYKGEEKYIVRSEVLHAILTHHKKARPLTIEAGVVRLADALDMEEGRARIPFQLGRVNIHSVSAIAIRKVEVEKGEEKPVLIKITMKNSSGIFQIDELLKNKLYNSGIESYVQVIGIVEGETESKIIEKFEI
ncbi:MAG: HD domain-containing protein [Candidatus Aenigmarchaeota archaeon]|nr:HD domain-containing protein [Candidatus Aenigmarchaeota archaeon]